MKHLSKISRAFTREKSILIIGDGITLLITTLIGFATHASSLADGRWLTSFLPLVVSWGIAAPWLGVFKKEIYGSAREIIWRAIMAMVLAGPLAALLRALMLGSVVIPVFALVLAATCALAIIIWRILFIWGLSRKHDRK